MSGSRSLRAATLFLFGASTAFAEDTRDIESLLNENVITTASTSAEKASTAPATSTTLTAEDLAAHGIRSLDEAIDFLALGVVTSDGLRTPDIGARGVLLPGDDGKHFLLLVNGHSLNDPLYGAARFDQGAGIPFDLVDRIEVVVGPGSVLYGSNAMLGVINVITKRASDYSGGHVLGEYEVGRSGRAAAGAGFSFRLLGQPSEITVGAEYFSRFGPDLDFPKLPAVINTLDGRPVTFRRGGPADGIWGGTVRKAYFTEAPSGMLRFRTGDLEVNVLASAYRRGLPYSTGSLDVDFDDPESRELDRALRLDIKHEKALSSLVELTSRAYADSFDYQRWVNRSAIYGCLLSYITTCQYHDAGRAEWAGIEERVSLNWLEDSSLVTLLGVDARMRWVAAKEDEVDFATGRAVAPTAGLFRENGALLSPYVQQTWSPTAWLDLNGGARLDAERRYSPVVSPRGAVSVSPVRTTTFRAVYSQAFRAPTWFETDGIGYHQAASESLKPEVVRSVEGSVEQRFGAQRLQVGVFRSSWENLVEPHTLSLAEVSDLQSRGELPLTASGVAQYRNVSTLDNFGYNAAWDGSLAERRFTYGVNVTEAVSHRRAGSIETPLVVAPQIFGNAHLAYAFGGYVPTVALAAFYVGKRFVDRSFSDYDPNGTYAGALAELRATLTGRLPGIEGLGYRASATYATSGESAYVVGRYPQASAPVPVAPIDRFRVFVALRYDFGGESGSSGRGVE